MKRFVQVLLCLGLALGVTLAGAPEAAAQTITTGTITGSVIDPDGGVLPGVTVIAVHVPTGTSYETLTRTDGRFTILAVRVGGPYTVTAKLSGFREEVQKDINVGLGEDRALLVKMRLAGVTDTVQVVAEAQIIDPTRAGAGGNISNAVKEAMPTIQRSIYDIARTHPLFNSIGGAAGDGSTVLSVAGSSFRYNSLQIDGALNNDLFGLSASAGTPGGGMDSQPIAFDAIQEIQLVISPYDVRQGGFSGGGINAITKSGSNSLHGTGFYFGRNQSWVGKGADNRAISSFSEKQFGGSLGGRLVKNRVFFFGSGEGYRRLRPTGVSIASTGQQFLNEALVDQFLTILKNNYGYDPGPNPKDEFSRVTDNNKYFGRMDFNLGRGNQLTVRHNFVDALTDVGTPSLTTYRTPDSYYRFVDRTNSSVVQLNSAFKRAVNELRVAYTTVEDHREPQPFESRPFPQITVTLATGLNIVAGREQFSAANELDQKILEVTDSLTLLRGQHAFTFGTNNQFFTFRNLFIRDNFGTYRFSSLANFQSGFAQQFDHSFSATSDPRQAAAFGVRQWGLYAGDIWRARPNFTLTYGMRVDLPQFPDTPSANPVALTLFTFRTDTVPKAILLSPRLGFNVDPFSDGTQQIRGGIGIFAGRPPYVWISNQYGNTGVDFTRIGASLNTANRIPFVTDPAAQPKTVTGATAGSFSNEIDLIDPDFKYPSVIRANLAYDRQLPWGWYGSGEVVLSLTQRDIKYRNLNYVESHTLLGVGGRPFFIRSNSSLSDVIFLTNTTAGGSWTASYEVRRPFKNGWFASASYAYGQAKTIMDGTSDQAASTWGNVYVPGDSNNPPLTRSNFDPGHRINLSASRELKLPRGIGLTASVFYAGQSGRPYTLAYSADVNGDGRGTNDLLYIPASATEFTYSTGTSYQDLLTFIQADSCLAKYVGTIIPRNACRAPWTNTLDAKLSVQLPFKRIKAEITLDALNLINLLDSKGGQFRYASFGEITAIGTIPTSVTAIAPFTGYNLSTLTSSTFTKFLRDDLRSRWQMQLGGRIRF